MPGSVGCMLRTATTRDSLSKSRAGRTRGPLGAGFGAALGTAAIDVSFTGVAAFAGTDFGAGFVNALTGIAAEGEACGRGTTVEGRGGTELILSLRGCSLGRMPVERTLSGPGRGMLGRGALLARGTGMGARAFEVAMDGDHVQWPFLRGERCFSTQRARMHSSTRKAAATAKWRNLPRPAYMDRRILRSRH